MMNNDLNFLYIHIPFCDHICSYCDFYKKIAKQETISKYIDYLDKELTLKQKHLNNIIGIYIGGGTPSSIGIDNLKKLFNYLNKYINLKELKEFSIECNPKDVNKELIILFKDNNVNRLSLGIQSFNNKKLKFLNRNHTKKDAINCIKLLRKLNFKNFNVDIMYGLPKDSKNKIQKDLKILKKFNVKHISCYSLILEEKTMLYNKYLKNEFKLFNEDEEAKIYYSIQNFLTKHNYKQYELSNFSKENYECLYNINTWNNLHYLGIGTSASYYINNKRYTNIKNLNSYFEALDNNKLVYDEEILLNKDDIIFEEIMLGLRKTEGFNYKNINKKYNVDVFKTFPNIDFLLKNNLLIKNETNIFIPHNKLYISNTIINKVLE